MTLEELAVVAKEVADRAEESLSDLKNDDTKKPADVARHFWYIKTHHDEVKKQVTRVYHVMDALDKHVLPELLEAHGTDIVRIPDLGRSFSVRKMMSASMLDKEQAIEWLRGNGAEDLVQETVNAGTLSSFIRNLVLEEGIDPPEELFKVSTYNKTSATKYTPKS